MPRLVYFRCHNCGKHQQRGCNASRCLHCGVGGRLEKLPQPGEPFQPLPPAPPQPTQAQESDNAAQMPQAEP